MKSGIPRSARLEAETKARGVNLAEARPLAGDGSDRRFFRLPGEPALVLLYHPRPPGREVTENDSYFLIGRHLAARGVPVPEISVHCRQEGWMLLEDVGDLSLAEAVAGADSDAEILAWYRQALNILLTQQLKGEQGFNPDWCFDTPAVTGPFLLERECRYFVRAFLQGYLGLAVDETALLPEFERLLAGACPQDVPFFLHRDFQSRNLFVQGGNLRVLDFQGGRLGPLGYDLAALLIDPYVDLNPSMQEDLLSSYQDLLGERLLFDRQAFREQYDHLALCRNLQILGAFGFLTRVKGKPQFARYIPTAVTGLRRRLAARPGDFPRLAAIAEMIPF
jgi:aminoglycoside/choline kinase family phosphotransferase|uniref:Aminoglycoside phosphotransferase n=1 Tax=Desulfobacca acetoxidans TaxID=60893 RepID=A0A7V6A268_9BACT